MVVVGIDLSGPSNIRDTVCACFRWEHDRLELLQILESAGDEVIRQRLADYAHDARITVGLDAPLSYNLGGGDRPSDKALRQRIVDAGLRPGSVMPPTMTRMAYLTLRGVSVARLLGSIRPGPPQMVEIHPGGAMILRGAPVECVRRFKREMSSRQRLMDWLQDQGMHGLVGVASPTDHMVAACATALAAWKWQQGEAVWLAPAQPPHHPFDYAC